jgi:2Fe-2S ferredoxin
LKIKLTTREGQALEVESSTGCTLMEAIRDSGVDEITALCGGCMACATCHVYVDAEHQHQLPPMSNDESALLDSAESRTELSRLSCQIPLTEDLDGLSVTIAPSY